MAQGKKSFIAYSDWAGIFNALPDDVAGKLIKHIFNYVNDLNPSTDDYVINALFEPIKSTLKRDLVKWETQQEQRKEAGKKSAEIRKQNATSVNERSFSSTVNDNVSVSDNVNDNVSDIRLNTSYQLCVDFWLKEFHPDFNFNATAGKKMKSIIEKFKTLLKNNGKEITENTIFESFKIMCQKLPEWYKNKDLSVIDSKFNEIIQEIKNGTTNSKQEQRKDAAAEAIRLLTGTELR